MNSKLRVIIIVGAIVLVCGVAVSAAGYAMGGMKSVMMWGEGLHVLDDSDKNQVEKIDETFEKITAIDIDLDGIESVTVKEGSSTTVKGRNLLFFGGLKAECADDGTLVVTHSIDRMEPPWIIDFPSIFSAAALAYPSSYLEITTPQGTSLSAIDINVSFGDISINGAVADETEIDSDSGNVSVSNLVCESFKLESNFGKTDAQNINAKDVIIASDSGDVKLWNLTAPDGLTINSSFGNIDLETVNAGASKFELASGNLTARGVSVTNGVKINSSFGDIEITGALHGNSEIESDSGDLALTLDGVEDDYAVSVESNAGEVTFGDRKFGDYGNGRFENGPSSAPNNVKIQSNFGNVDVTFRG